MVSPTRRGASSALPAIEFRPNGNALPNPASTTTPSATASFMSSFSSAMANSSLEGSTAGVNTTAAVVIGVTVPTAIMLIVVAIAMLHCLRTRRFRKGLEQRRKESLEKRLISYPVMSAGHIYTPYQKEVADVKVMGWYSGQAPIIVGNMRNPFKQPSMSEKQLPGPPLPHGFKGGVRQDGSQPSLPSSRGRRSNRLSRWSGKTGEVKPQLQVSPWDIASDRNLSQPAPTFLRPSSMSSSGSSMLSSLDEHIRTLQVADEEFIGATLNVPFSVPTFCDSDKIISPLRESPSTKSAENTGSKSSKKENTAVLVVTSRATNPESAIPITAPRPLNPKRRPSPPKPQVIQPQQTLPIPRPNVDVKPARCRPASSVYVPNAPAADAAGPIPASVIERANTLAKTYRQLVGAPPTPAPPPIPESRPPAERSTNVSTPHSFSRRAASSPRRREQRGVPLRIEIPKSNPDRPFARRGNV